VVSKCQIAFESKAQADEKAQHTFKYVSILKRSVMHISVIELVQIPLRGATQLSDARWGFETTSNFLWRLFPVLFNGDSQTFHGHRSGIF
jgi:hypothetical protein